MEQDDQICLCHHVSLRKLVNYMRREKPAVPSQLSSCLDAGTSCQWCVPFLCKLHKMHQQGEEPTLTVAPENYAKQRDRYREKVGDDPEARNSF